MLTAGGKARELFQGHFSSRLMSLPIRKVCLLTITSHSQAFPQLGAHGHPMSLPTSLAPKEVLQSSQNHHPPRCNPAQHPASHPTVWLLGPSASPLATQSTSSCL